MLAGLFHMSLLMVHLAKQTSHSRRCRGWSSDYPVCLRQILTLNGEIDVVGECVVGPDVVKVTTQIQADILMLDLRKSDSQVWTILKSLRQVGTQSG